MQVTNRILLDTGVKGESVQLTYDDSKKNITAIYNSSSGFEIINVENFPNEFKDIKSNTTFIKQLQNANAKIEKISDGVFRLSIERNQEEVVSSSSDTNLILSIDQVDEMMRLVEMGKNDILQKEFQENAIILAGRTGAGKSTLGNLMNGCKVELKPDGPKKFKLGFKDPLFPVGHSNVDSCTRCPNIHTPENKNYTFIDYPGFDDTDGVTDDTLNVFFRKEVLKDVRNFKIVLIIDYVDIKKKGTYFTETFNSLIKLFGFSTIEKDKFKNCAKSISLIINQVPASIDTDDDKVKEEIADLLDEHLEKKKGLSDTAKSILRQILVHSRWDFVSTPYEHISNKHAIEIRRVSKIIHEGIIYSKKSDADIQAMVNDKYVGCIQSAITDIVEHLDRVFSEPIYHVITNHLQEFYAGATGIEPIKKFQEIYAKLIASKEETTLSEFLGYFNLKKELAKDVLKEAAEHDKRLKFLNGLLPPYQAKQAEYSYRKDWLDRLHLRTSLEKWNAHFKAVTTDSEPKQVNGVVTLKHYFPRLSQLNLPEIKNYQGLKRIEVFGLHSLIIDQDLDLFREGIDGVDVVLIAPHFEIQNRKIINVSGKDNTQTHQRAANGEARGDSGTNGKAGHPGTHGGHVFAFSNTHLNENLTLISKGGKGGVGQEGGDGKEGTDGSLAHQKHDFVETKDGALCRGTVILTGWDHVGEPFHHGDEKYDILLRNWGGAGGNGGAAGMGGAAGKGGQKGNLECFFISNSDLKLKTEAEDGRDGDHGSPGSVGEGGLQGLAWGGVWHVRNGVTFAHKDYCDWNGWHKPKTHDEGGVDNEGKPYGRKRGTIGTARTIDDTDPTKPAVPNDPRDALPVWEILFNYRKFAIEAGTPLTAPALEAFRSLYDRNPLIVKKSTVDSFIKECDLLEDLYASAQSKLKILPLYQAMLERIRAFEIGVTVQSDIVLLNCLHTMVLSKICQINATGSSRLIINIKEFLGVVDANIKLLDRLDHNVQVELYKTHFEGRIKDKIKESKFFIQKLMDDIKEADHEVDEQIQKLLKEIAALKNQNAEKKNELIAKKKELEELMSKKKLIGAITIAVQAIGCCFPPAGPIIAAVASIGLQIYANSASAPQIAAQVLSSYAGGIEGVLSDRQGAFAEAHIAALSRVRTLTLTSAAYSVVDTPGNSDTERLEALKKGIKNIDDQQAQLDKYQEQVETSFNTSMHEVVSGAKKMQQALEGQSKIALDFSRLSVKRAFENVKIQVKECTKAFASGKGFLNIIKQMEDAIQTTADIYDHVQEYEERLELVDYMARLAAPTVQDPRIEKYKQKVLRNVILEQYSRAVAATNQWAFPYASIFLGDFTNLDKFAKAATIDDLIKQVTAQLVLLRNKVKEYHTEVNGIIDDFIWTGKFSGKHSNGPFYVWTFAEHEREIMNLLRGRKSVLFADVARATKRFSAVKFTDIELQIKCKDDLIQEDIDDLLKGVTLKMQHSGLSYYTHEGKVYQMVNDKGFTLGYEFFEDNKNNTKKKLKAGDYMLSPYTPWALQLNVKGDALWKSIVKLFRGNENPPIEIHLAGKGQYIHSNEPKLKNWITDSYTKSTPSRSTANAVPVEVKEIHATHENAFAQKNNENYWYTGVDVHTIVQSKELRKELEGFHFIQGMQADHLKTKLDEIFSSVKEGKPVLCVYNLSDIHWVTFCIVKKGDGDPIVLYKDSYGKANNQLLNLLQSRLVQFKHHVGNEQASDNSSCCLFSLQNMRIMAREISKDPDLFIKKFEAWKFCTLEEAKQLRKNDFPALYQEGVIYQETLQAESAIREKDLRAQHQGMVDKIVQKLKLHRGLINFKIQQEEVKSDAKRTIGVQVGANDSQLTSFHYRIQVSKDTVPDDLEDILCQIYPWQKDKDYRVENGIIKVASTAKDL